jgi:hypothetical protein
LTDGLWPNQFITFLMKVFESIFPQLKRPAAASPAKRSVLVEMQGFAPASSDAGRSGVDQRLSLP